MRTTRSRSAAPTNAMMIVLMIGWPTTTMPMWNTAARKPPRIAPRMPTIVSPITPRPWPSARWLARNPATRPTKTQSRIVSKSSWIGAPFTVITIPNTPYTNSNAQPPPISRIRRRGRSWRLGLACQLAQRGSQHAVECRVGVNHIREYPKRGPQLHSEDELAENLPGSRARQRRADQHSSPPVTDQLQHPTVKVVDIATRSLGRGRGGGDAV